MKKILCLSLLANIVFATLLLLKAPPRSSLPDPVTVVGKLESYNGKLYRNRYFSLPDNHLGQTVEMYVFSKGFDETSYGLIDVRPIKGEHAVWKRLAERYVIEQPFSALVTHPGEALLAPEGFVDRGGQPLIEEPGSFIAVVRKK